MERIMRETPYQPSKAIRPGLAHSSPDFEVVFIDQPEDSMAAITIEGDPDLGVLQREDPIGGDRRVVAVSEKIPTGTVRVAGLRHRHPDPAENAGEGSPQELRNSQVIREELATANNQQPEPTPPCLKASQEQSPYGGRITPVEEAEGVREEHQSEREEVVVFPNPAPAPAEARREEPVSFGEKGNRIVAILEQSVQESPDEPVSLAKVARQAGATRAYVSLVYAQLAEQGERLPLKLRPGQRIDPEIEHRRQKVKRLWEEKGLTSSQIAEKLGLPETTIDSDIDSLRSKGKICYRKLVDGPAEEKEKEIKPLFKKGRIYEEIQIETGLGRDQTRYLIGKLQKRGELPRRRKHRRPEEIKRFDARVEVLREQNLEAEEIAERLETSFPDTGVYDVRNSISRLLKQGRVEKKPRTRKTSPEIQKRRQEVKRLRGQELSRTQIAGELRVTLKIVDNDLAFLRRKGEIEKMPRGPRNLEVQRRRKKVKERWKEGLTRAQIAEKLEVTVGNVDYDLAILRKKGEIGYPVPKIPDSKKEKVGRLYRDEEEKRTYDEIGEETGLRGGQVGYILKELAREGKIKRRRPRKT